MKAVVRCLKCHLNQFVTQSGFCRRCHFLLFPEIEKKDDPEPEVVREVVRCRGVLAERVVHWRRKRGMTQWQLADRMEVPRTYISKLEGSKSQPTIGTLERLSKALDIPVAFLVETDCIAYVVMVLAHDIAIEDRERILAWCESRMEQAA